MKSKKRHQSSSEDESEGSETSKTANSSSGSESDDSSVSEHRYKKKRKRADSSDTDSESDDQKRSKKRKHKKKKKKHGKKKRHSEPLELSDSVEQLSSVSEGEISYKKKRKHKHKHKHSKRARTSSASGQEEAPAERRLHSVVKERRGSSQESQPSRTYYQKEYRRSGSGEDKYEREREVQRFYRGSSKERRQQYGEHYQYERGTDDRYTARPEKYERNREKYIPTGQYAHPNEDYNRRLREYDEFKRTHRYEERRYPEQEYHRKPREEQYHVREDTRGNNRYNPYEDRGPKRREFDDGVRDYRERRSGPPVAEPYQEREKKEKYREDMHSADRDREDFRARAQRADRPPISVSRERPKSRSPDNHYRDKNRRDDREERYSGRDGREDKREAREDRRDGREERRDGRDERRDGPEDRRDGREDRRDIREDRRDGRDGRDDRRSRPDDKEVRDGRAVVKTEPITRERKSRFEPEEKQYSWGKDVKKEGEKQGEKEKPNFGLSGKLTADVNMVNGVVIKYTEPDDAKQPKRRWRFYPFKGDKALPILYIHRQSCFVIGRDKKVVDIALEHPSVSKQHAALQYRATPFTRADGSQGRRVRPYVIDLDSANGTFVNNKKIEPRRYVELLERDVVKFGFSQREYVLLHENSKDGAMDDDNEPAAAGAGVTTTQQIKQEKRVKEEMAADGE